MPRPVITAESVHEVVDALRAPDAYRRLEGIAALRRWRGQSMTADAVATLLDSVDRRFPRSPALGAEEPAELLVRLVWERPQVPDLASIEAAYRRADDPARVALLRLLAEREDDGALHLLGRLLGGEVRLPAAGGDDPLAPLVRWPRSAPGLAEGLAAAMADPDWSGRAAAVLMALLHGPDGPTRSLVEMSERDRLVARLADRVDALTATTARPGAAALPMVADLAEVLAALGGDRALTALHRMLACPDPQVAVCAAVALVSIDRPVAGERLGLVARDHRAHLHLVARLAELGGTDLLPESVADQVAIARSELAVTLDGDRPSVGADHGGRSLRDVRCLGRLRVTTREGDAEMVLFRFEPDGNGFGVGHHTVAACGPYLIAEQPTARSLGPVLCTYRAMPDLPVEELLRRIEREFEPSWRPA